LYQIAKEPEYDRFSFGENWLSFLDELDDARIVEAERSLQALLGLQRLDGKRVLDIGSGSGLSSLAARRLGAIVHSFDYDLQSVQATQGMRDRFYANDEFWTVERGSVLDKDYIAALGTYDIVYSWGVLHHTGAMYDAIANAAACVRADGLFAFALYRKTSLCWLWRLEKRWYTNASPALQKFARSLFIVGLRVAFFVKRRDFGAYVNDYKKKRGMHFTHDIHDWMGGYPYESISPAEVAVLMDKLKLELVRSNISLGNPVRFGCDEYVYRHF
jgi:SAM-dependent methyltransferase